MAEAYEIVVEAGSDVLRSASKCEPIAALEELVWNALDADATRVDVDFKFNDLQCLEMLRVTDNGIGFEVSAKEAFGSFGSSPKKLRDKTPGGRLQHGREGRGRYKALALGTAATWTSIAKHLDGKALRTVIRVDSTSPNRLSPSEELLEAQKSTGVVVEVSQPSDEAATLLSSDIAAELALRFAPYLLAYRQVELYVNGSRVDPATSLMESNEHQIRVEIDGVQYSADVLLCIWKRLGNDGKPLSRVFFCTADGFAIEDHPGYVRRLGVSMTAYVKSSYFTSTELPNTYSRMGDMDSVAREFLSRAKELMRRLNREKLHEQARQRVAELKSENLYPFVGEPKDEVETAERQVFDIVAEQLHFLAPDIAQDRPVDRKRKMEALRVAITTDPSIQSFLVEQVLGLKPEQQKDFYEVLQRVPLANVVGMAKTVLDRLHFIAGLRHILFEPEVKKLLRERTQLHRILAEHVWLFGEQFHLGADDISLKNVLKRHRAILGLEESAFESQEAAAKGLNDVPDLMLYRSICHRPGHFEHLVVELKAPRIVCGEDEFAQIERYASTVAECDDFDKTKTRWRFFLVNNAFEDRIYERKACQRGREPGLVLDHDNYQVWALPWSTVIQDVEGRHQFLKERLAYQIKEDAPGLDYLRANFGSFLPDSVLDMDESDEDHAQENGRDEPQVAGSEA